LSYVPVDGDSLSRHEAFEAADEETIEEATIPVERIDAPVLLYAGEEDAVWPSARLHRIAAERLAEHGHEDHEHLVYERAGHTVPHPYLPIVGTGLDGGEQISTADLARASVDSWSHVVDALNG
jgi:dienelactone hydrolase